MTKNTANAIQWWLESQSDFSMVKVDAQGNIVYWGAQGIPQPSAAEIQTIIANFENYQNTVKTIKASIKNKFKTVLGLTADEMKFLMSFLRGE